MGVVGECFKLLVDRNREIREEMLAVAKLATFAENEIWTLWRKHDPLDGLEMLRRRLAYEQARQDAESSGQDPKRVKWPKIEAYKLDEVLKTLGLPSSYKIAAALCPGVHTHIPASIANVVHHYYAKQRLDILRYVRRLPVAQDLRIRVHKRCISVRRSPVRSDWFDFGARLRTGGELWMPMRTGGASPHTLAWLSDAADGTASLSCGTISAKKRGGKLVWQIALARQRRDDERERVANPVLGRSLLVWAPLDQEVFLWCQADPIAGRPWRMRIEAADLLPVKRRHEQLRQSMGRNYAQSPEAASHGHGRRRAIGSRERFRRRYEDRIRDWIENRSLEIVRQAIEMRCERIRMEKLTDRTPGSLLMGDFPYYRLMERTEQKAKDAGLGFELIADLETFRKRLGEAG